MKTPILLSVMAVVLVSSATAGGIKLITGANIKDGTIEVADLSKKAQATFKGRSGAPGPTGPIGPQGPSGSEGPAGPRGATGQTGAQGTPGPAGSAGVAGPSGAIGNTGLPGAAGPQGPAGQQGPQGAQGSQGPTGAQGASATSLWAVVQGLQTPVLHGGSGVVSVSNAEAPFGGNFSYDSPMPTTKVTFNRDVSGCAYIATSGAADDAPLHQVQQQQLTGTVFVQPHWQPDYVGSVFQGTYSKDVNSVLVTVRAAAAPNLLGFHLAVFC